MIKDLETKTGRLKLMPQWKPYWLRLGKGVHLGYRRHTDGAGTWNVRLADGKGGNTVKRIATADDEKRADGTNIMSFAQARDNALKLGRGEGEDDPAPAIATLKDAIAEYRADLEARKAGL